jgi:hypothetical protein
MKALAKKVAKLERQVESEQYMMSSIRSRIRSLLRRVDDIQMSIAHDQTRLNETTVSVMKTHHDAIQAKKKFLKKFNDQKRKERGAVAVADISKASFKVLQLPCDSIMLKDIDNDQLFFSGMKLPYHLRYRDTNHFQLDCQSRNVTLLSLQKPIVFKHANYEKSLRKCLRQSLPSVLVNEVADYLPIAYIENLYLSYFTDEKKELFPCRQLNMSPFSVTFNIPRTTKYCTKINLMTSRMPYFETMAGYEMKVGKISPTPCRFGSDNDKEFTIEEKKIFYRLPVSNYYFASNSWKMFFKKFASTENNLKIKLSFFYGRMNL